MIELTRKGKCPECGRMIHGVFPDEPAECGYCGWNEYLEQDLEAASRDYEHFLNNLSPDEVIEYERSLESTD